MQTIFNVPFEAKLDQTQVLYTRTQGWDEIRIDFQGQPEYWKWDTEKQNLVFDRVLSREDFVTAKEREDIKLDDFWYWVGVVANKD